MSGLSKTLVLATLAYIVSLFSLSGCRHYDEDRLVILQSDSLTFEYRSKQGTGRIRLSKEDDSLYHVSHIKGDSIVDIWPLPYPVYRFDIGDLTGDSVPEICVGVIKSTRYWKERQRRLFIFHLYRRRFIRPLWLGSRVGGQLIDFYVDKDSVPAVVHTLEKAACDSVIERIYGYGGFGLKYKTQIE